MADVVRRRIAHCKKIRASAFAQSKLIDSGFRELRQIGVRERAHFPLVIKCVVGLVAPALAAKHVGKCELPALGRFRAQRFFVIQIGVLGERKLPRFSVVFAHRVRLHKILDERH